MPNLQPALYPIQMNDEAVEFDQLAFDNAIVNKGVKMVHFKALRSPVGMIDKHDIRKPNEDHSNSSVGWLYRKAGETFGLSISNSKHDRLADIGDIEGSTIRVTFPRNYIDGSPMRVAVFDRFYLSQEKDIVVVPHWQIFEAHETGIERLTYPVYEIEYIVDSSNVEYKDGDYTLLDGQVVWNGTKRPIPGAICSIRYTFRPYWYVYSIEHEIRLNAHTDFNGNKTMAKGPQSVVLQRERIFENQKRDDFSSTPGSLRQTKSSSDGSFGPR